MNQKAMIDKEPKMEYNKCTCCGKEAFFNKNSFSICGNMCSDCFNKKRKKRLKNKETKC